MNVATAWRSTRRSGSGPQAAATSTPSSSLAVSRVDPRRPRHLGPRRADSPAASVGDDARGRDTTCRAHGRRRQTWPVPHPGTGSGARASVTAGHGRRGTHCPARGPPGPRVACGPDGPVARTADLVAIPSESHHEAALADVEALRALAHLHVDRFGDNVVARTTAGRALRLVVAGHLDTVPVNDNGTPEIRDDVLWGSAPPT